VRRSNQLKGRRPGRRRRPRRVRARPRRARRVPRLLGVLGSMHGRDLTLVRARRRAMTARPRRPPGRLRVPRRCPGPRPTTRPTAPRSARPRPTAPPRTEPQVLGCQTRRPVGCHRFLSRPRPGLGLNPAPPGPTRGLRDPRAFPAPRGCRDRRGPRSPRPTSVAPQPAKGAKGARPGPRLHAPARRAAQGGSAQVPPQAVPTRAARAARAPGRPHRGPRDLVRPGRVRPGQADPVRARALRVPARGRATTRSAQPRPAWGRHPRRGPRAQPPLVSRAIPVVPAHRPAARAAPAARVLLGVVPVGPACPMAARVPAAPGQAR
jgi:hypothetical protein